MKRMSSDERLAQAEECLASGMTVREWCAANGVPAPTMYAWVRRLREERSRGLAPAFVEVAAAVGYQNAQFFSRVFKQSVGLPPASYRKNAAE